MTSNTPRILEIARSISTADEPLHITSLQSPDAAEALGRALADTLSPTLPDIVVVWDQVESAVLGHVVARELRADLAYGFSEEGSLGTSGILGSALRAVVVSYDWTELYGLDGLIRLVESRGAVVVGIGSIIAAPDSEEGRARDVYALVRRAAEVAPAPNRQTHAHGSERGGCSSI